MMKLINELYEEGVKLYVNNILKIKIWLWPEWFHVDIFIKKINLLMNNNQDLWKTFSN
jgi:hypothetical protein